MKVLFLVFLSFFMNGFLGNLEVLVHECFHSVVAVSFPLVKCVMKCAMPISWQVWGTGQMGVVEWYLQARDMMQYLGLGVEEFPLFEW